MDLFPFCGADLEKCQQLTASGAGIEKLRLEFESIGKEKHCCGKVFQPILVDVFHRQELWVGLGFIYGYKLGILVVGGLLLIVQE